MVDLNYKLAPRFGMTATERRQELDTARFVDVRNLVYLQYKKPDGSPMMTYPETLDNRDLVKQTVINYEIAQGFIVSDDAGLNPQPQNGTLVQPTAQQPMMPFAVPSQAAPQPFQAAPPPQQMMHQPPQSPQMQMPAQQSQMQPTQQMMQPPQQTVQQVPMAASPGEAAAAPVAGRRRRGSAVAPPAGAAPQMLPPGIPAPAPAPLAAQPFAAPQAFTAPQAYQPQQAAPFNPAPNFGQAPAQAPAQAHSSDLSGLSAKLDSLGHGLEIAAQNSDAALKVVNELKAEIAAVKNSNLQVLVALHHIYMSLQGVNGQPILAASTQGAAQNLAGFQAYLQNYTGVPVPK